MDLEIFNLKLVPAQSWWWSKMHSEIHFWKLFSQGIIFDVRLIRTKYSGWCLSFHRSVFVNLTVLLSFQEKKGARMLSFLPFIFLAVNCLPSMLKMFGFGYFDFFVKWVGRKMFKFVQKRLCLKFWLTSYVWRYIIGTIMPQNAVFHSYFSTSCRVLCWFYFVCLCFCLKGKGRPVSLC